MLGEDGSSPQRQGPRLSAGRAGSVEEVPTVAADGSTGGGATTGAVDGAAGGMGMVDTPGWGSAAHPTRRTKAPPQAARARWAARGTLVRALAATTSISSVTGGFVAVARSRRAPRDAASFERRALHGAVFTHPEKRLRGRGEHGEVGADVVHQG